MLFLALLAILRLPANKTLYLFAEVLMYILQGEFKKLIGCVCLVAWLSAEHWLCFVNGLLVHLFK